MVVIGIDPGLNGAVAAIDAHGSCAIEDMPTVEKAGEGITSRKLCGHGLAQLLRRLVPAGEPCIVVLEDVHVMPRHKSGAAANTSLMHSKGVIEGVLGVLRMEPYLVDAQTWKRSYGLIDSNQTDTERKRAAMATAHRLFPGTQGGLLKLAKHHNRAEALLLARYGQRKFA